MASFVYLVGAGPGAKDLLTIRAFSAIAKAEVVVYDALVGEDILSITPKSAEMIYVGKRFGHHSIKQEDINDIIVEKALQGFVVVRLKGGDPFVFGRGGEEAECLLKHNIPFEVIPGVTSGLAIPLLAGIPVTHRGVSRSVTLITGHPKIDDSDDYISWKSLVESGSTLVFYMGLTNVNVICNKLMDAGLPASTPTAMIMEGTLPGSKMLRSTLRELPKMRTEMQFAPPAIIVVGEVARYEYLYKN